MVRGQYTAGTGMMLQRRAMEVVTNNIVNAETSGYKRDIPVSRSFDDVLLERIQDWSAEEQTAGVGPYNFGTRVDMLHVDFSQGNLETTDSLTDISLAGEGFFVVNTPQGERYSRNGSWTVNADGYLVDSNGYFLMSEDGPINVGTRSNFTIDYAGYVQVAGEPVGRIRVVNFEDLTELRKLGDNLFAHVNGEPPVAAENYQVMHGILESSNVEIAREMVDMITVYRLYETNQRMLTMTDEIVGKAVNEIGRLR